MLVLQAVLSADADACAFLLLFALQCYAVEKIYILHFFYILIMSVFTSLFEMAEHDWFCISSTVDPLLR